MFTKDDVATTRSGNGLNVSLSDAERQAIADEWNANDILRQVQLAEQARFQAIRDDALRQQLKAQLDTATNAQISAYVDAQVTDLASARTMFKRLLLLLAAR